MGLAELGFYKKKNGFEGTQDVAVSQSKERNYEPSIILGYVFRMGLRESGNYRQNRPGR
jgi:hypothetical protein